MSATASERFWAKVDRDDPAGCWLWTAGATGRGYGAFKFDDRQEPAHRIAYRLMVGPIADDMTLDHLCRVRRCVNPAHLEVVSRGENVLRVIGPSATNARKTRAACGHPFDMFSGGKRRCRHCYLAWHAARNERQRAAR